MSFHELVVMALGGACLVWLPLGCLVQGLLFGIDQEALEEPDQNFSGF